MKTKRNNTRQKRHYSVKPCLKPITAKPSSCSNIDKQIDKVNHINEQIGQATVAMSKPKRTKVPPIGKPPRR